MSEFTKKENMPVVSAGKRVFKLITGELIFGSVDVLTTESGVEFLIKQPFTAENGNMMPYLYKEMGNAPAAIQVLPMNVVWQTPLDEFKEVEKLYIKQTSNIII